MSKQNEEIDKRTTGDASEEIVLRNSSNKTCRKNSKYNFQNLFGIDSCGRTYGKIPGPSCFIKGFPGSIQNNPSRSFVRNFRSDL